VEVDSGESIRPPLKSISSISDPSTNINSHSGFLQELELLVLSVVEVGVRM
jgi:hypothetical protein